MEKIKIVAVVGPTASGKTKLGVHIAEKFGGEVVSGDSMQIYKSMDIATAKPSAVEMHSIPHHLIDFLSPQEKYSVASFCCDARVAVEGIISRGALPIIVGGTGLYIDSFLNNTSFLDGATDEAIRNELNKELADFGIERLYNELALKDPKAAEAIHINNTVRVLRALEVLRASGKTITEQAEKSHQNKTPYIPFYIGITYKDREKLYDRINSRVDLMLKNGLVEEARDFYMNNSSETAAAAIGYKELLPYINGEKELSVCVECLKQSTRRYAKRQLTWFKRNDNTHWLYADDYSRDDELFSAADKLIIDFLGGEQYG